MTYERDAHGAYRFKGVVQPAELLSVAEELLVETLRHGPALSDPAMASAYCRARLGPRQSEAFLVLFLDTRHRLIAAEELFQGTLDGASVHAREVVRACLKYNAAAVIFAHNHPSGVAEPSAADRTITHQLREALALIGTRVLDHLIIGERVTSMAAQGLL